MSSDSRESANVPSGTSQVISRNIGLVIALTAGVFWARGTISVVGVIAIIVSVHLLAQIVALAEPEEPKRDSD